MTHYDLLIIGTGSGNSIPGPDFAHLKIAIVEKGVFGGTCLNVGCIPSKMFEYPAEITAALHDAGPLGVHGRVDTVDWPAIRDRIFGRIDAIAASGERYRKSDECPNIDVYTGTGHFTGVKQLEVALEDGTTATVTADRIVLAAGSRPVIPDIDGLSEVAFHTSDTVMRLQSLPKRMVVVGGGFIAAEFGHIFASFGVAVTQVVRGSRLLSRDDKEISGIFTEAVAARYPLHLSTRVRSVAPTDDGAIDVTLDGPDGGQTVQADVLLLATGRRPNGDLLDLAATGVDVDERGYVVTDAYQRTNVDGIYALGDICSPEQLKHLANRQAKAVAYNLAHPDDPMSADLGPVPSAVFTSPQIATVGLTEDEAVARGIPHVIGRREYGGTAAGWAREDGTGLCKIIADPETGLLLGAHLIGPEAATVIQPAITAIQFGIPARELATGQYWIHPALPEVLENALLEIPT